MQYTPFASDIELPFYTALSSLKINHDRLNDSARNMLGLYEIRPTDPPSTSCRMQIHGNALTSDEVPAGYYRAEGISKNFNTIEEYQTADKALILQQAGRKIWDAIADGTIYDRPSLLSSFIVISFADLKKYKFHYWFAFPAIHSDPSWVPSKINSDGIPVSDQMRDISSRSAHNLTQLDYAELVDAVQTWSSGVDSHQRGFFLARRVWDNAERVDPVHEIPSKAHGYYPTSPHGATKFSWRIAALGSYEHGFFDEARFEDCYLCFADPSNYTSAPGWMLRNLLVLVKQRWKLDKIQVIFYRDVRSKSGPSRSIVITLELKSPQGAAKTSETHKLMPKVTGWERSPTGKLSGRIVDLTEYMDPRRLADQSVDLNLKLMKWRISPSLNLEKIKHTKCLLLGAGTLGSYVARNLLGWGVTKITFVDNGSVSFSNPVRQPLFRFMDCLEGGARKAYRASQALSEIYPGVDSAGHVLSVPMAGHPITDNEKSRADFEALEKLVHEHDAIFLLMDTRESRWLPTVMGKAAGKIVMNAALGFDSFVVMRHGVKRDLDPESELGCYFCNDVVAPANSVKDLTLDQQCTVTRPGVAAIASALLVELFVSLLQHPEGAAAPAPASRNEDRGDHPLGLVPHQIRGFLPTFENITIIGRSYQHCSACSDAVTNAYRKDRWDFVQRALNESGYVEELSGLKEVQLAAEATAADVEWDESSVDEEEEII
ncbi:Autophagy protein 7 [Monascus purpureus]|uniref:Ubiquitin-like modifier-activating enzyme ATG7 n=1 Tax=Monascus purpureus TaxID=5098 RepID=A0A507R4R1_MONPU|nr:Autophagy protein 7 [Monascus purpureus]BDD63806.1 Autophagy protein 7 [Monascus purpureus]